MSAFEPPFDAIVDAPFGAVGIRIQNGAVSAIELRPAKPLLKPRRDPAAAAAARALETYFEDARAGVDVPVRLSGTAFQRRVWGALRRISAGECITYGELATRLGTSPRAVGGACRANPVPILIPCHRVVAAKGAGGFMGSTRGRAMDIKNWLLRHEREDNREPRG